MKTIAKFEKVSFKQWMNDTGEEKWNLFAQDKYQDIILPRRATRGSAGYDFFACEDIVLPPHSEINFKTGIRCKIEDGYVLMIFPRSGLGFKYGMGLKNTVGIIDSDYYNADNEGHIACKLVNPSDETIIIGKGKAFAQGIFVPYFLAEEEEVVSERKGGFGSTSK